MSHRSFHKHNGRRKLLDAAQHHKRLAASISVGVEASLGPIASVDVAAHLSLSDTTSITSSSSTISSTSTSSANTTTTSSSALSTSTSASNSTTTTTTNSTSTASTSTTTTSTLTSTSTTSSDTTTSSSKHRSTRPHTKTSTTTTTTTFTTTTTTTSSTTHTSTATSTSFTTSTFNSSTLFTHTTFSTSILFTTPSSSSTPIIANTSSSSFSINIPVTSGVLGSGQNDNQGFAHDTGAIVGVAIGILAALVATVLVFFFLIQRFRNKDSRLPVDGTFRSPIDDDDDIAPPMPVDTDNQTSPVQPPTSTGHGSGEDGDPPIGGPGSVEIHGASVESGGTSYPHSQGHSTSSGDHLLNATSFAPFALHTNTPILPSPSSSGWQFGPAAASMVSPTGQNVVALSSTPPPSSDQESPATGKTGPRFRFSLLDRVLKRSSRTPSVSTQSTSSTPIPFPPSTSSLPSPPEMSHSHAPDGPLLVVPGSDSTFSRERNLSNTDGLLHPQRPDLFTMESSRTLMDHVDYSRPILPAAARHQREGSTTTSDTKSTTLAPDTEGQVDVNI